jgi:hypothetical protein
VNRTDTLVAHSGHVVVTVSDSVTPATKVVGTVVRLAGVLLQTNPTSVTTNSSGVADFTSVPPGSYTATVFTPGAGYQPSATTYPVTLAAGDGTQSAAVAVSLVQSASLDVTLAGLVNSDKATVGLSCTGCTAAAQTNKANGHVFFTDLPPNVVITVTATPTTNVHYTGGTTTVTLSPGQAGTATATLAPQDATLEITVTGLINGNTTTVSVTGGGSKTFAAGVPQTFTGLTPGVSRTVTFGNTNYTGSPTSVTLDAGEARTGYALVLAPKDGSVQVSVAGLLGTNKATLTITGTGVNVTQQVGNSPAAVTGLPANVLLTVTLSTPSNYSTSSTLTTTYTLGAAEAATGVLNVTYLPDPGSIDVTATGSGGGTVTATATWAGGSANAVRTGNGLLTITGVPSGVVITVSLAGVTPTKTGTTTPTATLTAGELHHDVGNVNLN